jgi:hypothetical protein
MWIYTHNIHHENILQYSQAADTYWLAHKLRFEKLFQHIHQNFFKNSFSIDQSSKWVNSFSAHTTMYTAYTYIETGNFKETA